MFLFLPCALMLNSLKLYKTSALKESYKASCKLMLFGEYLVLRGSDSLAIPLTYSQIMAVEEAELTEWNSYRDSDLWFQMKLDEKLEVVSTSSYETANELIKLFRAVQARKSDLSFKKKFTVIADFDLDWGIGSSSTLISLLSQWSGVDGLTLLNESFGGSGYDVACAGASGPIVYTMERGAKDVSLSKNVTDHLLFVYSGNKQSSKDELKVFDKEGVEENAVFKMNQIIEEAIKANSIERFETQIITSEELLSNVLNKPKLSEQKFSDYPYAIKSLGAWGGDFFLATFRNEKEAREYFTSKGLKVHYTYNEIIKDE